MRVTCKACGAKAIVQSTKDAIPGFAKMYCICSNPMCGHTFVATWSYLHTLNPGMAVTTNVLVDAVRAMEPTAREKIIKQMQLI